MSEFLADVGLALLLTEPRVWYADVGPRRVAKLVPSNDAGYWHVAIVDYAVRYTDASIRPMSAYGVELFLRNFGIDAATVNWQPGPRHAFDTNPFLLDKTMNPRPR